MGHVQGVQSYELMILFNAAGLCRLVQIMARLLSLGTILCPACSSMAGLPVIGSW